MSTDAQWEPTHDRVQHLLTRGFAARRSRTPQHLRCHGHAPQVSPTLAEISLSARTRLA